IAVVPFELCTLAISRLATRSRRTSGGSMGRRCIGSRSIAALVTKTAPWPRLALLGMTMSVALSCHAETTAPAAGTTHGDEAARPAPARPSVDCARLAPAAEHLTGKELRGSSSLDDQPGQVQCNYRFDGPDSIVLIWSDAAHRPSLCGDSGWVAQY